MHIIYSALNSVISAIGTALSAVILLLPATPFTFDLSSATPLFKLIYWLIPLSGILSIFAVYLPAVIIYYGIRVLLRNLKMAGD